MEQLEDLIVDISPERERFFGTSGRMLIPSPSTIGALLGELPADRLITTDQMRSILAARAGVEATCPPSMLKSLQALARDETSNVEFWRVIKKNGDLIAALPGGIDNQSVRLVSAGFDVDRDRQPPRVTGFASRLFEGA
jgi:hypothetical protein